MEKSIPTISESVDSDKNNAADLDQALAVAGVGWYNIKYCLVLALFLIAAIVEPSGYSFVLPASKCDLQMTDAQRGFIASIPFIGVVVTSYPWGYLVDTWGRKRTAICSSLAAGCFGVLSGFMPELNSFIVCKFLTALCIAGPAAVPYTFIGEILPQKYRDITLSIVNAMQIFGSAFVPLIAMAILPFDFRIDFGMYDFRPWRLLTIVNALFFIIAAVLMSFGPESPKFLVAQGKHDEALIVLQKIYAGNKKKSPEDYPIKSLKVTGCGQIEKQGILASLKTQSLPLLMPPYVKWLALNGFLLFGVFAVLNGVYVWVPDILNRVITGNGQGLTACEVIAQRLNETAVDGECIDTTATSTYIINIVANSSCAVIAVVGSSLVRIFGKKTLIVAVYFIIGTFVILINFITQDMVFAALLSSFPITAMTIGPINAFAVEIFPTELRGMAISLAMMIGRSGSVMGANVAGVLLNKSCQSTFYLFGGLLILCGLLTFLLPKPKKTEDKCSTRL